MRRAAAFATRAGGNGGTLMLVYSWLTGGHAPKLVQIIVGSMVSIYSKISSPETREIVEVVKSLVGWLQGNIAG